MDARLKTRIIITVAIWLLLAVLLALALSGTVPALADGTEPQQERDALVPRAWLPLTMHSPPPPDIALVTHQAVVEAGAPFFVELHVLNARDVRKWQGGLYFDPAQYLAAQYEDGLWAEVLRTDDPPTVYSRRVDVGQWSLFPASRDDALVALFTLRSRWTFEGTIYTSAHVAMSGKDLYAYRPFYVMACVCDWTGDGKRDMADINTLLLRHGCAAGDACYSPWYDMDGDGVIGDEDVAIATLYWHVDCP